MKQAILYRNQGQVVTGVEDERVRQQLLAMLLGKRHPVADVESVEVHIQLYGSGTKETRVLKYNALIRDVLESNIEGTVNSLFLNKVA